MKKSNDMNKMFHVKQLAVSIIVSNTHIAAVCFVNEFISMCTHTQIDHMK